MTENTKTKDAEQSWLDALPEELRESSELKRFKNIDGLAKSYLHANQLVSTKLGIPSTDADASVWDAFYQKLGRPETADGYSIDGAEELANHAKEWFLEAGLTQRQAETLAAKYQDFAAKEMEAQQHHLSAQDIEQLETLKREWGGAYDRNVALAQRAVRHFGGDLADLEQLEDVLGAGALVKLFYRIGSAMTEDAMPVTDGSQLFSMTAEQAKSEIKRLMGDKQFNDAFLNKHHPRHADIMSKRAELFRIAYPAVE